MKQIRMMGKCLDKKAMLDPYFKDEIIISVLCTLKRGHNGYHYSSDAGIYWKKKKR